MTKRAEAPGPEQHFVKCPASTAHIQYIAEVIDVTMAEM